MLKSHEKFHSSNGKRLILVADDEFINREILGIQLEADYEVIFAENGQEALDQARQYRDDLSLVLLDLMMPVKSGREVLEEMREDPALKHIPVIVLTADHDAEIESLHLGANDFIPKPYNEEIVRARVQKAIELSEDRAIIQHTERDPLTGLYNLEYFYGYVEQYDQHHKEVETDAIVVDVNHFHMINERFGNAYGDEILRRIGERIRETVAEADGIVCRRGGDTFMVYCPHGKDYKEILENASIGLTEGETVNSRIRLRLGVYEKVDKSMQVQQRFDRAKLAADTVRGSLTRTIGMYDNTLHERELYAEQLIDDFHTAIEEKQFKVYYQPKFDIRPKSPALTSAEALVRWQHPKLGMISPGVFIPLFEHNGLIQDLDAYVWRETAAQVRDWKERLGFSVPVSVNVSRIDMYDPELLPRLRQLLQKHDLSPDDLFLEITESAYTQDSEQIIETVNSLREIGFKIEMDDFGTGYSSLNMISTLPIDALKLDMQFVRSAFKDQKDTRMLEVIIDIANHLSVPVIAEGVETEEQMLALKDLGCDIVQGYYFSRPVPSAEFETFLNERKALRPEDLKPLERTDAASPEIEEGASQISAAGRAISLRSANTFFVLLAFIIAAALVITEVRMLHGYLNMVPLRGILLAFLLLAVIGEVIFITSQVRLPLTKMVEGMKAQELLPPEGAEELRFVTRTYNEMLSESRKTHRQLSYEASHDVLTGLMNRTAYEMFMEHADKEHIALAIIDVDEFKAINDTYGHDVGDRVLKRVAEILMKSFRSVDAVCRLGGDEFIVVMTRANSSMQQLIINKIEHANMLLQEEDKDLPKISLSVGVAFADRENPNGDLFKDADTALYQVKRTGRRGCLVYGSQPEDSESRSS